MTRLIRPPGLRLLAAIAAVWIGASAMAAAQQGGGKPLVTVVPVTREAIDDSAVFTGRVEAVQRIDIRARVAGFIQQIGFEEGSRIAAGDTLFRIEPDA
ncbi:MAG: hypothetical protein AAF501_08595 [Pseudomonadota bacterium]